MSFWAGNRPSYLATLSGFTHFSERHRCSDILYACEVSSWRQHNSHFTTETSVGWALEITALISRVLQLTFQLKRVHVKLKWYVHVDDGGYDVLRRFAWTSETHLLSWRGRLAQDTAWSAEYNRSPSQTEAVMGEKTCSDMFQSYLVSVWFEQSA